MATEKKVINKRKLQGVVKSAKMAKTIVVEVASFKVHPKYKKQYKLNRKFKVHDEKSLAKPGDKVIFEECRPISKEKKWRLISIAK